jgi:hypothetical protein
MKMGGVGGFEVKQDFTAMGARKLHVMLLCVCNDLSSVEGAMKFTKGKLLSSSLEGLLTSGFLTYLELRSWLSGTAQADFKDPLVLE